MNESPVAFSVDCAVDRSFSWSMLIILLMNCLIEFLGLVHVFTLYAPEGKHYILSCPDQCKEI